MTRRSQRIRLGRRSRIEVDVEGEGGREAEAEVVVVVVSGVGGEGEVGEVSRKRMQTKRERRGVVRIVVMEMPERTEYGSPKSVLESLLRETAGMENVSSYGAW